MNKPDEGGIQQRKEQQARPIQQCLVARSRSRPTKQTPAKANPGIRTSDASDSDLSTGWVTASTTILALDTRLRMTPIAEAAIAIPGVVLGLWFGNAISRGGEQ